MGWSLFWKLFRLSLVALCVGGLVFPVLAQVLGGLVLFYLVFGPPKRKPK